MANRITELVTRLVAKDDASKIIEHVADDLDKLEKRKDVEVGVGVEDKTEAGIREIDSRLDGLSRADKQIVVRAQATAAQKEIDRLVRSLKDVDKLDDEEVKIRVEALGNARAELKAIEEQAERLDKEEVDVKVDADTTGIKAKFSQLKTDLASQSTAMGKLGVLGSGAFAAMGTAAVTAGATAAVAIGAFATKVVTDFQKVALEAGKMRDSLGLTAEEASRLQEVAGDLGIPADTLATALGRMSRATVGVPEAFDNIGAAIVRNRDGTINVNETFLRTIDALRQIPDASERATVATKIFGRGWSSISEMVTLGSEDMKAALESVEEVKIVDDEEIARAREMRDRMDDLKGKIEEVTLESGEALLPVFIQLAEAAAAILAPLNEVVKLYDKVSRDQPEGDQGWMDDVKTFFTGSIPNQIEQFTDKWATLQDQLGKGTEGSFSTEPIRNYGEELSGLGNNNKRVREMMAQDTRDHAAAETQASSEIQAAQEGARRAVELQGVSAETAAEQNEHLIETLREQAAQALEMSGAMRSLADINIELTEARREQNELAKDENATAQDRIDKAIQIADLEVAQFEAMRQAAGATTTETEKLDALNGSLLAQAEHLKGPARTALLDYIGDMNGIPPEKRTEIEALIDEGKLAKANRKLADASAARTATITADAETTAAEEALDRAARDREVLFYGTLTRTQRAAGGTIPPSGEVALVGEQGPEIVALPGRSRVYTAGETAAMLAAPGGTTAAAAGTKTVVINMYSSINAAVIGSPHDVMRAVEDAQRRGARLMPVR